MRKKQKNVPPVTEEKPEKSVEPEPVDYKEPEVVVQEPKPLTVEERFERLEMAINEDRQFLGKLVPLVQAVEKAQSMQAQTQGAAPQPQGFLGSGDIGTLIQLMQAFGGGGGGDNELAQLGNQYGKLVLKQAIDNVGKPSIQEQIGEAVLKRFVEKKSSEAAKDLE